LLLAALGWTASLAALGWTASLRCRRAHGCDCSLSASSRTIAANSSPRAA
jgi:hypothetical protein